VGDSFTLQKNGLYFTSSFLCIQVSTNGSCSHSKWQCVHTTPLGFSSMGGGDQTSSFNFWNPLSIL
jgi:hypothetical protein